MWCIVKASQAVNAMGLLSKNLVATGDKLLLSDYAASSLLSLAAQMALEVRPREIREIQTKKCSGFVSSLQWM